MTVQDPRVPDADGWRSPGDLPAVPPVDRTCTELTLGSGTADPAPPRSLSDLRDVPAYVLLGDPGAGKTTEFERESEALGEAAVFVSARDFVTFDPADRPEWREATLFIDGLDEMRAGAGDARSPLDEIRRRLDRLGRPRFRLSCREADWLGGSDRRALDAVAADGRVTVLRLEPLGHGEAEELLRRTGRVPDVTRFVQEARRRGVDSMLDNPLTLRLLAAAVGREGWPDGRLELFEAACRQLASERNEEHQAAARNPVAATASSDPGALVDAAGHLCALWLLGGHDGFALEPPPPEASFDPEAPAVSMVSPADLREVPGGATSRTMGAALSTSLFRAEGNAAGGHFVSLHRQVAEFLAARFLAQLVASGLPAGRVRSLMVSPADARVVTPLRGLAAWLAAHSPRARPLLIEADPVGMALYGDVRRFDDEDKRRLLSELEALPAHEPVFHHERPSHPDGTLWVDAGWAFRALTSAGMVEPIKEMLGRHDSEAPDERIELLVLDALAHAEESEREHLRVLLPELEERVRDDACPPAIRRSALDAYQCLLDEKERSDVLLGLLNSVGDKSLSDPDDDLRGTLLDALYPDHVRPKDVWRYFTSTRGMRLGRCWRFWNFRLLERSNDDHVAELLDALDAAVGAGHLRVSDLDVQNLHMQLLARGLPRWGEDLDRERLYRWLTIPITDDLLSERHVFSKDAQKDVQSWLGARPEKQKAVFLARLEDRISTDEAEFRRWADFQILHGSRPPVGFGLWCLERAVEHADTRCELAEELLRYSYSSLNDPALNEGLTLDVMSERVCNHGELARRLKELSRPRSVRVDAAEHSYRRQVAEIREQQEREERQRQQEWAEEILSNRAKLLENCYSIQNLYVLAKAYLGMFSDSDDYKSPEGRLADFLGGDSEATDLALAGLRGSVLRRDLPKADETVEMYLQSQQPYLSLPVLASLHMLDGAEPAVLDGLATPTKRRILTIYCLSSATIIISTAWYRRWLNQIPDLTLDVLHRSALAAIRSGAELPDRVMALEVGDREAHHRLVGTVGFGHGISSVLVGGDAVAAHRLRLRLLEAFPTRAPKDRLPLLDGLLFEALSGPEVGSVKELARQKLAATSMTVGQRVRWLTVDAALSGALGVRALKEFVEHGEIRARHLAEFLRGSEEYARFEPGDRRSVASMLSRGREPATLGALIEMLGAHFPFEQPVAVGSVTLGLETSDRVAGLIAELGSVAGDETEQVLSRLIGDDRLATWRGHLNRAQRRQRVVNRDATYRHRDIEQIQEALNGTAPANVVDLHALLVEHLAEAGAEIRGADSNLWRQFWNEDRHGRPHTPKHEESCRDALLALLRPRLPRGVDVQPEAAFAADARADVRASYGDFHVPVEIKRDSHRDLWRAVRSQLIPKYTTDPTTSGYGIYLVLWFGTGQTTPHPERGRPTATAELRLWLEADLTAEEAQKIAVVVMDVTKPSE